MHCIDAFTSPQTQIGAYAGGSPCTLSRYRMHSIFPPSILLHVIIIREREKKTNDTQ